MYPIHFYLCNVHVSLILHSEFYFSITAEDMYLIVVVPIRKYRLP